MVSLVTAFFEPVSAALLLLEKAVIALIWVMIQLKAFLTPLLATVLQMKEQYRYRNGCKNHSLILFCIPTSETEKYALKRPDPLSESNKGKTLKS